MQCRIREAKGINFPGSVLDFLLHIVVKARWWDDLLAHITSRRTIPSLVGVDVRSLLAKDMLNFAVGLLTGPLLGLTLAMLMLRLRQPRPPLVTLLRQPGFVACLAAPLGVFVFIEANYLGGDFRPHPTVAGLILGAWAILAVSRRWEAEAGWIDRLGRLVGAAWLALAFFGLVERRI